MIFQAQIGYHYGLPYEQAIASLTSAPARTLGLDHRIGYLRPGYDADVVLWDSHPLRLGSRTLQVWIDGVPVITDFAGIQLSPPRSVDPPIQRPSIDEYVDEVSGCHMGEKTFIVNGIRQAFSRDGTGGLIELSGEDGGISAVFIDGELKCLDRAERCHTWEAAALENGARITTLRNGFLLPVPPPMEQ